MAEGHRIGRELIKYLNGLNRKKHKAIGIAAPQLGIFKQVSVITLRPQKPILLVNPRIVEVSPQLVSWTEGCLSFPGEVVKTWRHAWVVVETDNLAAYMAGAMRKADNRAEQLATLESVCYQHEIAHLFGLTIFDFQKKESWRQVMSGKCLASETRGCLSQALLS